MEHILNKIKEYNRIIIHGHVAPDGDCIGSQYGLYHMIKASFPEKEVYVTGDVCEYVAFLGKPTHVDEALFKGALSICVDCATAARLSDQNYKLADYVIKIDHHIDVEAYGNYQLVDTKAASCTEILTEFYNRYSDILKLNYDAAYALYTGLVTDSGRFRFDSVSKHTFNMAGILVSQGINISEIDTKLSLESIKELKFKGWVLDNFQMTENGCAYIKITRKDIEKYGLSDEDAAAQVSTISTIEDCPVWVLVMEYPDAIRMRLRSRGPAVNLLANEYAGGGHAKASGATLPSWDEFDNFIAKMDKLAKDYKASLND